MPSEALSARARLWFEARYGAPTPIQREGWPVLARGSHALLIAPTGTGKTLAAFFVALDRLLSAGATRAAEGVRILYVSPLKALAYDIDRNLREPLSGLAQAAAADGAPASAPAVGVRTGDTPASERRKQERKAPPILATTPESLYLMLGSKARGGLESVEIVIVDEIHALAGEKRGAHLALSLERLAALTGTDPQRIGLSATVRPAAEVARFLAGSEREAEIVDVAEPPALDLEVVHPPAAPRGEGDGDGDGPAARGEAGPAPAGADALIEAGDGDSDAARGGPGANASANADALPEDPASGPEGAAGSEDTAWSYIEPRLLELIRRHRQTIIFASSRALCERLAQRLSERAGEPLVAPHHGSIARDERARTEERLKSGALRALVATSSLELGIDIGALDRVVLLGSPGSVSRALQRAGRAGHRVGARSSVSIVAKHRAALLECAAVARGMRAGSVESLSIPRNPLDVLAQQLVAICADGPQSPATLGRLVRRAYPYRELGDAALERVLEMLAGTYPASELADFRPRLRWDRARDELRASRGGLVLARLGAGAIPDRGAYPVVSSEDGRRVGELDEEMVFESRAGDVFALGASTWRIQEIGPDRVLVAPAPGQPAKLPFWRGEGPGRPLELGRAIGALAREIADAPRGAAEAELSRKAGVEPASARDLIAVLDQQRERSALPTDRDIVVEKFRDAVGDWRLCVLTPFGAPVHAPWALAVAAGVGGAALLRVLHTDDGLAFTLSREDAAPRVSALFPDPEVARERAREALADAPLFAGRFREAALRALLIPKPPPGRRSPLWQQRQKAARLLAAAREHPDFPLLLEAYRECLEDLFDLEALAKILADVQRGDIRVTEVETRAPSPLARSLAFAYEAAYLYEQDAPLAERRAQALAVDPELLGELLGRADLRELLDPRAVSQVEAELARSAEGYRHRDEDDLHDHLRRAGDLTEDEIRAAAEAGADRAELAARLEEQGRAARVAIAGETRWVAAEFADPYRELSRAEFPAPGALAAILERYARVRGPFTEADARARYGAPAAAISAAADALARRDLLVRGAFRPGGGDDELCHADVLRRLRRRSRELARGELAPAEDAALARFLASWHELAPDPNGGPAATTTPDAPSPPKPPDPEAQDEALARAAIALEGLFWPADDLFSAALPARLGGWSPAAALDRAAQRGELAWVGGPGGRVALLARERAPFWLDAEPPGEPSEPRPAHRAILERLETRGASFLAEIEAAARDAEPDIRPDEIDRALWDLIGAGRVTADSFAPFFRPLRAGPGRGRGRLRGGRSPGPGAGRFSSTRELRQPRPDPTVRARAQAEALLERYGVASARAALADGLPGGFGAVYPVLREMEARGLVQRGNFVASTAGPQFATSRAVDALRSARAAPREDEISALLAADPAQPYGALLAWPDPTVPRAPLRRAAGAWVVLERGAPAVFLAPGGRSAWTFRANLPSDASLAALRAIATRARGAALETVDGEPVRRSPLWDRLRGAGFLRHYRGLTAGP